MSITPITLNYKNIHIFNKHQTYCKKFDYYSYLWFRYHRLFFHSLIFRGRKLWAFNFFISVKFELKSRDFMDPFWTFLVAMMRISPAVLLFPKKLGGSISWVPLSIKFSKKLSFAVKWIIKALRDKDKNKRLTPAVVCDTLLLAIENKGLAIEKKMIIYKTADANRHLVRFFRR